jgi:hypothetical protein
MKLVSAICATAAVALLAGCATYTAVPAGPAVAVATPAGTQVWYDSFYGPIYAGYWGSDGLFHYQLVSNGPWLVDTAGHFRREAATGYTVMTIRTAEVPLGSAVAVATPASSSIWYDDFYGPVSAGYWGSDGLFHYRLAANGPWLIDSAGHFRHQAIAGYHVVTIAPVIPPG